MKVHVHLTVGEVKVDQVVTGETAEEIVASVRDQTARQAGFLIGAVIRRMTPLEFAREATRRYNTATKSDAPLPDSCEAFIRMAQEKGLATVEEEA